MSSKNILNLKQERFAQEVVLNGGDKVAAFKVSGWTWKNYTKNALGVQADKKYNHPKINLRILELQKSHRDTANDDFKIDSNYVLRRLHEIDNLDVLDIIKPDLSGFRPLDQWPKSWRISISALDMKRMITTIADEETLDTIIEKVKWPDKAKNLDMIGRHVTVKAWDKDETVVNNIQNIMPVPSADNIDDWEAAAKAQQEAILNAS